MGPGIPIGKYIPISVMVDDIKVSGQYILASSITTWIEVQMVEPLDDFAMQGLGCGFEIGAGISKNESN